MTFDPRQFTIPVVNPDPGVRELVQKSRELVDIFHQLYYHGQPWQETTWRGVKLYKTPMDLWIYQEIVHELRPDLIIETGTLFGGSAYYFASLMDLMGHGRVITIDIQPMPNRPRHPRITYLEGSSTDPALCDRVRAEARDAGTVMVVLDSNHGTAHVLAEMRIYADLVSRGSYLIVEDSNINGHPVLPHYADHPGDPEGGPMEAITAFMAERDDFAVDTARHKFMLSFNPNGYLRRG
jgi:cephalosporin hydroxylase